MHAVVAKVKEFLDDHVVRGPGIVACSGGPDSVALLRALQELQVPLTVAHMNHQLRGEESDGDEAFVQDLANRLGVPFESKRIELPTAMNLEAAARQARYDWLDTLDGNWIATGHTMDDQAETVLHRIIRGTGLQGLRGILDSPPTARGRRCLRPLLHSSRADVLDYLCEIGQEARLDSSNSDTRFTRNRIRHELLPVMKTINSDVVRALCRLAEHAAEADAAFNVAASKLLIEVEMPRAGKTVILARDRFQIRYETFDDLPHPYLVREMLRVLWEREAWPRDRMTFRHWDMLTAMLAFSKVTDTDLPGGIHARTLGSVVQLGPRS